MTERCRVRIAQTRPVPACSGERNLVPTAEGFTASTLTPPSTAAHYLCKFENTFMSDIMGKPLTRLRLGKGVADKLQQRRLGV